MQVKLGPVALGCCLFALSVLTACGGPPEEDREARTQAVAARAEWGWLRRARQELDARRQDLARAEAEIRKSGKDPAADPAVQALARDVRARSDELRRRLLAFINDNPPVIGETPSGRT